MSVTERRHIDVHEAWLPKEHPLHRPRHGGRQIVALICAGLFFLTPTVALSAGAEVARFENRELAPFPEPSDGWGWFTGLPAWAADHLPFRDDAVRGADALSRGVFGEPAPLAGQGSADLPAGPAVPGTRPPASEQIPASAFPPVIEGRDGWLYLGADVSGACSPTRTLDATLGALNRLRDVVQRTGRQFVLVVPPDKTTMVPEHLPAEYLGKDCAADARDRFWGEVAPAAGAVDLRPALGDIATRAGAPVYYPADTHWSHQGGLAMTYSLADRIQPDVTATWQVGPAGSLSWPDDISPLIGRTGEHTIPIFSLAPDGRQDRTKPVITDLRVPLHLGSPGEHVPDRGVVSRPVRMIADSFTQFAIRYLAAGFSDITIVHPDTVAGAPDSGGALLAEGEVVVLEVAERTLLSGTSPVLEPSVIDEISRQLARDPVR